MRSILVRAGVLAVLGAITASSTAAVLSPRTSVARDTATHLQAYGVRGTVNFTGAGKLDGALTDLTRHISLARPAQAVADLHRMSPAARFKLNVSNSTPMVAIDAVTRGDPQKLKAALIELGLQHAAVFSNDVGGWLPVSQLATAAARAEVHSMRAAMPHHRTGAVESQGDYVQYTYGQSSGVRSIYPALTGSGITVGVLSDSYDCYATYAEKTSGVPASGNQGYAQNGYTATASTDVSTGDLPSGVNILEEASCLDYGAPDYLPFGDEGRAMLQIVHDVAPGASLAFYTADDSEADFANGIIKLYQAGATVEADDVGYFDEPFFQDGEVAQAIDEVEANGVSYFSAAGNDSNLAYENINAAFSTAGTGSMAGETLLNFDQSAASTVTSLPITVPKLAPGEYIAIVLEWDQPYITGAKKNSSGVITSTGATGQLNLCVTGSGSDTVTDLDGTSESCTGLNSLGSDPVQILIIGNPANASGDTQSENLSIQVGFGSGTAPARVKVAVEDDGAGSTINAFTTTYSKSPTIQGHPGAAGAMAIGAAFYAYTPYCGTAPAQLESYSSVGGDPILFDEYGNSSGSTQPRQKPDVVGPDGVNTTFFGWAPSYATAMVTTSKSECQNANYPNFFGTSAATPHVAGIAALMLQGNSSLTPSDVYYDLRNSASAMSSTVPNYSSGYGFVNAQTLFASLLAAPLTLSSNTITLGNSATLTWSAINATSCTASGTGGWSGAVNTSGSQSFTPTSSGTKTFILSCSDSAGSVSNTVTLTVDAASSSSSHGGGGLDWMTLGLLAGAAGWRARQRSSAISVTSR